MSKQMGRKEAPGRLERVLDALEATRQALQLLNDDVAELQEENAELRERLAHLQGADVRPFGDTLPGEVTRGEGARTPYRAR